MVTGIGVGGGGAGGALAPPVGVRCRNFGQNFGQFHIFWAILRQNFGRFLIFWAILRQNFGQCHVVWASLPSKIFRALDRKTVSVWMKTFFFWDHHNLDRNTVSIWVKTFFFWRSPQFGQKKRLICQATFKSFFGQNFGAPPNRFELLRPWWLGLKISRTKVNSFVSVFS